MEELLVEYIDYLPISYTISNEEEYVQFLVKSVLNNYENGNWQFSYFAIHLLFMWYVYTLVWKIRIIDKDRFNTVIMIHDYENVIKFFENSKTPADYCKFPEAQIMHFIRLILTDERQIKELKKTVKIRNELAHCNCLVKVESKQTLFNNIRSLIDKMKSMDEGFNPLLVKLLNSFCEESEDPDNREYSLLEDEVKENLIHKHYLSKKDLENIKNLCPKDGSIKESIGMIISENYLSD